MHSPRRRLLPLSANKQVQAVVSFWFSIADRGSAVVPVQLERYDPVPALRKFLEKDDSQIRVLMSRAAACDDGRVGLGRTHNLPGVLYVPFDLICFSSEHLYFDF